MNDYEAVIGLEVHAQLSTDSKIFAPSGTKSGEPPNTLTDPVTLGLPGSLPVLNRRVVDFAIKIGLATQSTIERESVFARKHYLYPDLPKGYQISQYDKPLCRGGHLVIRTEEGTRRIGITRIHLEEDAGKNIHLEGETCSLVDLNRAGVALVEIVSEPELRSPEEAGSYMRQLRQILRYLEVCDGNMEEGSLRCDANISVRKVGVTQLGTKVEIKNLNSFKFVERALAHEIRRQVAALSAGDTIVQETRLYDEQTDTTHSMRSKEFAEDYRYFPDPDLPPLIVDEGWIQRLQAGLPELPQQTFQRFKSIYGLDDYLCEVLTDEKLTALYYDHAMEFHHNPQAIANWITTELFGRLNKERLDMTRCPVSPQNLSLLVKLIDEEIISGKIAKSVFDDMFATGASPEDIVREKGLRQITDTRKIEGVIAQVLADNPTQLADYRAGKVRMFGFFVGQVMRLTEGKANPKLVNELLERALKELPPATP